MTDQSRDRLAAFEEQYAGYQVYDSDGEKVGGVDDLFVDDNDDLKYIGVKVEHSETRSILIPMDAARVDEERRVIEVLQPKGKVHEGPTFDDEKEITLGFEERVRGHYGLRGLQSSVGGDVGQERGHAEREEGSERRPDTVSSVFNREDGGYREHPASEEHIGTTHRDAETGFEGYQVYDRHYERIGKVDDLFLDESDRPEYIGVKTGFLGTSSTLIPMDIVRVNDKRQLVEVEADKDTIKEGPTFGDDREITPEFEQRVLNYYQLETARASAEKKAYGPYYSNATSDERVDVLPGERAGAHDHLGERQQENEMRGADRERSDLGDEELRSEEEGRARASERQSERVNVRKRMRNDRQRRAAPNLPVDESEATAEEVPSTTDVPPRAESSLSRPAPASGEAPTGDALPRTAQSGWETPPPTPRRATPAETAPHSDDATGPEQRRRNHGQRDAAAVIGILVIIVLLLLAWWWGFSPSDEEALEEQPISPKQQEEVPKDQPEDKEAPKERVLPQEEEAESPPEEASPLLPIEEEGLPVEEGLLIEDGLPSEEVLLPEEGPPLPEEELPQ